MSIYAINMEDLRSRTNWLEASPQEGEVVNSHWQVLPGAGLINPWRSWLRFTGGRTIDITCADPVALGFIQDASDGELQIDTEFQNYRRAFGWEDERDLSGLESPYTGHLADTAAGILGYCRRNTFPSFQNERLGINLEFSAQYWQPKDHIDPLDHDVVPHQDWVLQDRPVVIVVAQITYDPRDCDVFPRQLNTNLWNGDYIYKGDLKNKSGSTIDYLDVVCDLERVAQNKRRGGEIWASDARRGLHGRALMFPNEDPVVRLFMRGFIAPV